jgi:hypothetical protein
MSKMPLERAQDSTAVSPYWAAAFFTTQQGTACAGYETKSAAATRSVSFAEHRLDAEPDRTDKAGDDNSNHGLESITLRLLDAFAPTPQVLEIGANFSPVLFIYPERDQDGGYGTQNHGVDIAVMQPLLLSQRLGNDRANVFVAHLP